MRDYISIGKKISLAKKGKPFSEEHRRALSEAKKRSPSLTQFESGHPQANTGRTHFKAGVSHYCWKGGNSLDNHRVAEYRKWRRKLLRINPLCSGCGSTEKLQCHHIDFNSSNNILENGQVLCKTCHTNLHKAILSQAARTRAEGAETTGEVKPS
jgi:exonuclease VII small subunit